jgi:hypothetical protein
MKKLILLLIISIPAVLFAQNGISVTNLATGAGTVRFEVSWNKTTMPPLWVDSAWVFVDYNNKGVIERLPLEAGATLTATSAPGIGRVAYEPNNVQGVWVIGNARTVGTFFAAVELPTAVTDIAGACAYASNYPPVGLYTSATEISFTGTPEYIVLLERSDNSTYTAIVGKGESLSIPSGETAVSFIDKTGAPGMLHYTCLAGEINGQEES